MPRSYGIFRAKCGHAGCAEFTRYEVDNRKHYRDLETRYGAGKYRCVRHTDPNSVLSSQNSRIVDEVTVLQEPSGLYWGKDRAFSGFTSGPGFRAFAEDFPPGTILRVTAEVILPKESSQ